MFELRVGLVEYFYFCAFMTSWYQFGHGLFYIKNDRWTFDRYRRDFCLFSRRWVLRKRPLLRKRMGMSDMRNVATRIELNIHLLNWYNFYLMFQFDKQWTIEKPPISYCWSSWCHWCFFYLKHSLLSLSRYFPRCSLHCFFCPWCDGSRGKGYPRSWV